MKKIFFKIKKEKGAAVILLTVLILGIIILIALGLSTIFITEIKTSTLIRQSGAALFAADAGAEFALYKIKKENVVTGDIDAESAIILYNGARYWVSWGNNVINSTGKYINARRKIQVTLP